MIMFAPDRRHKPFRVVSARHRQVFALSGLGDGYGLFMIS
jgi:hypothetical protein